MKLVDLPALSPAGHLAADEILLDRCEEGAGGEALRFFEPASAFVVLGHACRSAEDVDLKACEARGIPVLRRHSGGGTVLQMPGCLNYSLILRMKSHGALDTIAGTNAYVTGRLCRALGRLAGEDVRVDGQTDLVLGGRKIGGNAQRRRLRTVLFHGVLLLNADLSLITAALRHPPREPLYRNRRPHEEFLMNTGWPAERVKQELCDEWEVERETGAGSGPAVTGQQLEELVLSKYGTAAWTGLRDRPEGAAR